MGKQAKMGVVHKWAFLGNRGERISCAWRWDRWLLKLRGFGNVLFCGSITECGKPCVLACGGSGLLASVAPFVASFTRPR